eukprot:403351281
MHIEISTMLQNYASYSTFIRPYVINECEISFYFAKMFEHQHTTQVFSEFAHLIGHLNNFEFKDQGDGDFIVKLNGPLITTPIAIMIQGHLISWSDFVQAIKSSPFFAKSQILSFDQVSMQIQIQFLTTFSTDAFTAWLQRYYPEELQIVCNTAAMVLSLDAEPFKPKKKPFDIEAEKKKVIEKMYRYYNYLIVDKSQDMYRARYTLPYLTVPEVKSKAFQDQPAALTSENLKKFTQIQDSQIQTKQQSLPPKMSSLLKFDQTDKKAIEALRYHQTHHQYFETRGHRVMNDHAMHNSYHQGQIIKDSSLFNNSFQPAKTDEISMEHPDIQIRYTSEQMREIFKTLGRFEHPLNIMETYGLNPNDASLRETLIELTKPRANVNLDLIDSDSKSKREDSLKQAHNNILTNINSEIMNASSIKSPF